MEIGRLIGRFFMKYMAGNRNPKVLPDRKHIACIGDSITFGAGVMGKESLTWEHFLNEIIGDEYQVINYGVSGRTLQDEGDMPYTADRIFKRSLDCRADVYLIMLGTNDAKSYNWNRDRYERELEAFVRRYVDLENKPRVILMVPPRCFPDSKSGVVLFEIVPDNIDSQITEIVTRTAEKLGLQVIDLYGHTSGHPEWFADGVHPNAEGNRAIAEYIAENIKEAI